MHEYIKMNKKTLTMKDVPYRYAVAANAGNGKKAAKRYAEGHKEIAKNFLKQGVSVDIIVQSTGLTEKQVLALRK